MLDHSRNARSNAALIMEVLFVCVRVYVCVCVALERSRCNINDSTGIWLNVSGAGRIPGV